MSIQLALHAALSGLRATQQNAALVSHNITNATTPGFVRKELSVSAALTGGHGQGVRVNGVSRDVDELLIRDARFEQSRYLGQEARASSLSDYAQVIGQPQDERSVSTTVAKLQQAFERLHGMPDDKAAQSGVIDAANALAGRIHDAASAALTVQGDARARLSASVADVNAALVKIGELNTSIATQQARGADVGDLMDQRDVLLDQVSDDIGIRTYTRDNGQVVVMTRNGQTLLDRELPAGAQPIQIVNDPVNGLTFQIGGVVSANPGQDIQSGRIMGYFQVVTQDMPRVLDQLDGLAAGLAQSFQAAEADPTQPGLFTVGTPVNPGDLASGIAVNSAVQGNSWRVQSGVQATVPLAPGDQTQIAKFLDAFTAVNGFTAADMPATATLGDYATAMVSAQQTYRTGAVADMKTHKIAADTLQTARINRDGVNIDDEMQKLQLIEQSYGASAQVIQVAGRMIDTLLRIAE
ncbi:flagellar hook-associated protein FlgK [Azospirillum sp. TSO22-1]|uniref:flagellar hook-associated protein FlgK n=1 Tax=Azospirillum sp. TSO22-1 TaxID=716789 RepID=UPI000D61586A|nr:flagellar hook-associated protein FlgK [Azospirillum sp. TSO22-1]PWC42577.1 flagellar hook protein [Azospirillum sp. TSO22-1]